MSKVRQANKGKVARTLNKIRNKFKRSSKKLSPENILGRRTFILGLGALLLAGPLALASNKKEPVETSNKPELIAKADIPKEKLAPDRGSGAVEKELPTVTREYVEEAVRQTKEGGWGPITVKKEEGEELGITSQGYKTILPDGSTRIYTGVWDSIEREMGGYVLNISVDDGRMIIFNSSDGKVVGGTFKVDRDVLANARALRHIDATELISFLVIPRPGFDVQGVNPNLLVIAKPDGVEIAYYSEKLGDYITYPIIIDGDGPVSISKGLRPYVFAIDEVDGGTRYITILFSDQMRREKAPIMLGVSREINIHTGYQPGKIRVTP